jgi:hypothetical protein
MEYTYKINEKKIGLNDAIVGYPMDCPHCTKKIIIEIVFEGDIGYKIRAVEKD